MIPRAGRPQQTGAANHKKIDRFWVWLLAWRASKRGRLPRAARRRVGPAGGFSHPDRNARIRQCKANARPARLIRSCRKVAGGRFVAPALHIARTGQGSPIAPGDTPGRTVAHDQIPQPCRSVENVPLRQKTSPQKLGDDRARDAMNVDPARRKVGPAELVRGYEREHARIDLRSQRFDRSPKQESCARACRCAGNPICSAMPSPASARANRPASTTTQ